MRVSTAGTTHVVGIGRARVFAPVLRAQSPHLSDLPVAPPFRARTHQEENSHTMSNKNQMNKNQNTKTNQNTNNPNRRPARTGPSGRTHPDRRGREPVPASGLRRFRTTHPVLAALIPVGLVVAAVATMVVVKATGGSPGPAAAASHLTTGNSATSNADTTALPPSVVAALAVPASTLEAVGSSASVVMPSPTGTSAVAKTADGKVQVTYVGAEYCPYCAAERWAMAVALSRFGTLSGLSGTHSSGSDVYPNTQTLSFYGSSYSSPYVDFQPVEEATNQVVNGNYQRLQTPTAAQQALVAKYDTTGSIPFLDIGNKYVVTGASFSPQLLQGLSREQIAAQLQNPSSPVAQAIDGAANTITAAICASDGGQPASVCNTPAIQSLVKKLGA